jgi:predicted O-linked N-acetylglucosamine transferase (SPINDLY family)
MQNETHGLAEQLLGRARGLHQQGEFADADLLYSQVLELAPTHFDALHLSGVLALQSERPQRAVDLIGRAVEFDPTNALAHLHLGNALYSLRRVEEAAASYARSVELMPLDAEAHFNRGIALYDLRQYDAAVASYEEAIRLNSRHAHALTNRALALSALGRHDDALESYNKAVAADPGFALAHLNRGNLLRERGLPGAALESYELAIAVNPLCAEAHCNRAVVLHSINQIQPALESLARAIEVDPRCAQAYLNLGAIFSQLRQFDAAVASFDEAEKLGADLRGAYAVRLHAKMQVCNWEAHHTEMARLIAVVESRSAPENPFCLQALVDSGRLQRVAAETWARHWHPYHRSPRQSRGSARPTIRLGYFSADFREHPVCVLASQLFEAHDRSRFEIIAFSFGPDTGDPMRLRVARAFDRFIDVRDKSDDEIANLSQSLEIDIAIDLGGYTQGCRPQIFARRAAPVQVAYLGYSGTTGADFIDYLVADRTVIPPSRREDYSERIIFLPGCYQPSDSTRAISDRAMSREEFGLPPTGFVFACFSNFYKIAPATFDIWMRVLRRRETSVLWLAEGSPSGQDNLRAEADKRGVDPRRLVFSPRVPRLEEHLARHRLADLFLDTLPSNAHAAASDALWAGLPVLTCIGEAFAGRVAASLLKAVGLPELVAADPADYEERAVALAENPARLVSVRQRLAANRLTTDLFDTRRYVRGLESAFARIVEIHRLGLPPQDLRID